MASILARVPPSLPLVIVNGKQPLFCNSFQNVTVSAFSERQGRFAPFAKATQNPSESSTSLGFVKSVKNVWDTPEDTIALIGLGFAAVAGVWTSINLVAAIDKLPLLPSVFQLVGILYSSWFIYRYLLFKPEREELFLSIKKSFSDILGQ